MEVLDIESHPSSAAPGPRPPRLGFAGVGWIGRHRMDAIARAGAGDIAALCDPGADMIEAARESAPAAAIADGFDALLRPDVDGIVIATPNALHAEQTIRALEHGKAVFCQKPLARTAAEARQVVEAARRADRLLDVDLSYRYTAGMQRIRELIGEGAIGDVFAVDLVFHNAYGPGKSWFYDPASSGGGCLIDLGVHLVDLALWTLGFPAVDHATARLFAKGRPVADPTATVEDYALARLDLEGGAAVSIACSWDLSLGRDAEIGMAFYGTRGGLAMRNVDGSYFDFVTERFHGRNREVLLTPPDDWGGRAAVAWAERLATNPTYDPSIEHVVTVARVLDTLYGR